MPMGDANDDDSKGQVNGSEKAEITFVIHHFGLISIRIASSLHSFSVLRVMHSGCASPYYPASDTGLIFISVTLCMSVSNGMTEAYIRLFQANIGFPRTKKISCECQ
jgi:hypothetical protein